MEQIILESRPAVLKAKLDNLLLLEIDGKEVLCELRENQPVNDEVQVNGFSVEEGIPAIDVAQLMPRPKPFRFREGEA